VKRGKVRAKGVSSSDEAIRIRLLFADEGSFREEEVQVPAGLLTGYDRLIDLLREDPWVLKRLHVDLSRLCSAQVVEEAEAGG
jgi:hypothetical protein